jgi:hypothetical protein
VQYISTIIKDDIDYFRKNYGVQFVLDNLRIYFSKIEIDDENTKILRNSLIRLIKFYIQNEIKQDELDSIMSFLCTVNNLYLQVDILDLLYALFDSPNEPQNLIQLIIDNQYIECLFTNLADSNVKLQIKESILKLLKFLLRRASRIKNEKFKNKFKLDLYDGGYNGLINKFISNIQYQQATTVTIAKDNPIVNEQFLCDLLDTYFLNENILTNYDGLWTILSMLTPSVSCMHNLSNDILLNLRIKMLNLVIRFVNNVSSTLLQILVRSHGWQDILCQLLCKNKKSVCFKDTESDIDYEVRLTVDFILKYVCENLDTSANISEGIQYLF